MATTKDLVLFRELGVWAAPPFRTKNRPSNHVMVRFRNVRRVVREFNVLLAKNDALPALDSSATRQEIVAQILKDHFKPSESLIRKLYRILVQEFSSSNNLKLLVCATTILEWFLNKISTQCENRTTIEKADHLSLGRNHFMLWIRSGISAHPHNLSKSIYHFNVYFESTPRHESLDDYLLYFKALQMAGNKNGAEEFIKRLLVLFENHPTYPTLLFYAGAAHKAANKLDSANGYFHEASQLGPPKLFSKLEMMMIMSRVIEEGGGEADGNDEAYQMVHAHLMMEGQISSQIEYDDWIADGRTWLVLADKCALHQMYGLAADFYALAITRDPDAFKKPMLWFRFGKACRLCGRASDAHLAVRQALTRAPHCKQLLTALRLWNDRPYPMESNLDGELSSILQLLPPPEHPVNVNLRKLQAVVRGNLIRQQWLRGIGKRRYLFSVPKAKFGAIFFNCRPVSICVQGSWAGRVDRIEVFDHRSDRQFKLSLTPTFCSALLRGVPHSIRVLVSQEKIDFRGSAEFVEHFRGDGKEESLENTETLCLKLVDVETGDIYTRTLRLAFDNCSGGWKIAELDCSLSTIVSFSEAEYFRDAICHGVLHPAMLKFISPMQCIVTSRRVSDVARFGLFWNKEYFLVSVQNCQYRSKLTLWHLFSGSQVEILFPREHFDTSSNVVANCSRLLHAINMEQTLRNFIPRGHLGHFLFDCPTAAIVMEDKYFFVEQQGNIVRFFVVDVRCQPMFCDFFECWDGNQEVDDNRSSTLESHALVSPGTVNAEHPVDIRGGNENDEPPTLEEIIDATTPIEDITIPDIVSDSSEVCTVLVESFEPIVEPIQSVQSIISVEARLADNHSQQPILPTASNEPDVVAVTNAIDNLAMEVLTNVVDAFCVEEATTRLKQLLEEKRVLELVEMVTSVVQDLVVNGEVLLSAQLCALDLWIAMAVLDDVLVRVAKIVKKKESARPKLLAAILPSNVGTTAVGVVDDEIVDQDDDPGDKSLPLYFKIHSSAANNSLNPTLSCLLKRPVKRQPLHSSLASVLQSPNVPVRYPDRPLMEVLKTPLDPQGSTWDGLPSSPLFLPDIRNKPKLHKSSKKARKILFSSSFNPLQNRDDESSVGVSLSSTSWSNGRFSIERSIQSCETSGLGLKSKTADDVSLQSADRELITKYGDQEDGLLIQSVKNIQRLGYVPTMETRGARPQRRPWAYAAYWQRLLQDFLVDHCKNSVKTNAGINQVHVEDRPPFYFLRKQLRILRKALAMNTNVLPTSTSTTTKHSLTVEEMICALAETKGSIGEILLRLHDLNMGFLSEIQLACGSLNVRAITCGYPGGAELLESVSCEISAASVGYRCAESPVRRVDAYEDIDVGQYGDFGGVQEDDCSSMTPFSIDAGHDEAVTDLFKTPVTLKLFRPESLPCLRDTSSSTHLDYPHLTLDWTSPVVIKRAASTLQLLSPTKSPPPGRGFSFEGMDNVENPQKIPLNKAVSFSPDSKLLHRSSTHSLGSLTDSERQDRPGLEQKKSFRIQQQIVEDLFDEFSHVPVVVMARKDALRAHQEETVLKSNKQYLKGSIRKRVQQS